MEPDPLALAILLHMHDWQRTILAQPRVRWFIGFYRTRAVIGGGTGKAFEPRSELDVLPERYIRCVSVTLHVHR